MLSFFTITKETAVPDVNIEQIPRWTISELYEPYYGKYEEVTSNITSLN